MPYDAAMLLGIAAFIAAVLLWDLWLWLRFGYEATISGVIWHEQRRHWWVKWLAGAVLAFLWWHWFWG